MSRFLRVLLLSLLSAPALLSQQSATQPAPNPCAAAEQKQLNFWVGEWDLTWPGERAGEVDHPEQTASNASSDGCVVQERFSGQNAMHLRGTSVSTFDAKAGKWKPT